MRIAVLTLAMLAFASPTPAQPPPAANDLQRLLSDRARQEGDLEMISIEGGRLARGVDTSFDLDLDPDAEYMLMAACEAACRDLSVVVLDKETNEAWDEIAPAPDLRFGGPGHARVTVKMLTCEAKRCAYALAVYRLAD